MSAATVAAWENGRRFPATSEWFRVAAAIGRPVDPALASLHPEPLGGDLPAWLRAVHGDGTRRDLADHTGCSVHQVGRWLTGRAEPRAHQFLALVDAMTGRVDDLIAAWVDIARVPSLRRRWRQRDRARRLAWEQPWSEAVLQVLLAGAPSLEQVASRVGIAEDQALDTLEALREAGVIRSARGWYAPLPARTVDTGVEPERVLALKRHWATVAAARTAQADLCAYNVFSCTEEDMAIVREEVLAAFRRARARIASSPKSETAALLLIQLVPFEEVPGERC